MTLFHALRQPVGRGQPNAEDDVLHIKQIFERIGRLSRPDDGLSPFFDAPLEDAIRGFQKDRSLMIDGRMKPGGKAMRPISGASRRRWGGSACSSSTGRRSPCPISQRGWRTASADSRSKRG